MRYFWWSRKKHLKWSCKWIIKPSCDHLYFPNLGYVYEESKTSTTVCGWTESMTTQKLQDTLWTHTWPWLHKVLVCQKRLWFITNIIEPYTSWISSSILFLISNGVHLIMILPLSAYPFNFILDMGICACSYFVH